MKDKFLKLAGVKSEKEFYKLFPDETSFMAKYGKQVKKLQMGAMIQGNQSPQFNPKPISFQQLYDQNDMMLTGSTNAMRQQQAYNQANLAAQQKMSSGRGGGAASAIGQIGSIIGGMSKQAPPAKNGKKLTKAMGGKDIFGTLGKGIGKGVDKLGGPAAVAQSAGDIIGGIQQMRDEKQIRLGAQQMAGVSDIARQASMTRPEQVQKRYVRPEDNLNTGEEFFPIYGAGTVIGRNGTEIANTFAPNTIYTDLGYAQNGAMFSNFGNQDFMKMATRKNATPGQTSDIYKFAEQGGGDAISQLTAGIGSPKGYGVSGAGKLGKGIGSAAGTAIGGPVGGMIGGAVGQLAGNLLGRKNLKKTDRANEQTQSNIETMALNQGAQSLQQQNRSFMRDGGMTNPQIINQFGDYRMNQLLRPDPTMDTLRTGGQLRQNNMAMGGDLEIHYGGYAEPMSYNPYLPDSGETIMFRGQSHDESDKKGRKGIGITYGDAPVEVEGEEPAIELENGSSGDTSLTVYGNLKIPKYGAEMIGDSKAAGKKFKNYVADLSRSEKKQNSIIDKASTELEDLDDNNPFDLLSLESHKANMLGANMELKDIADKKIKAASLQSAINDTAEEFNLVADDLAKGKVKQAKKGASIKKAQTGVTNLSQVEVNDQSLVPIRNPFTGIELPRRIKYDGLRSRPVSNLQTTEAEEGEFNLIDLANQVIPYLRPTDAEALNPNQLSGEMFALATNQLEPVQAQTFQPQLRTPYDISLQDILNRNQADFRAVQRNTGYNPAALAALNAQKYAANQQVLGEQFRLNQGMRDKVYGENTAMLNQSTLQNMGIFDQQYQRQQQALSNTKATTQAALNSISAKYAQNELENRNLQTYENLYNFRFDPRFRANNMNPLAQFNLEGSGMSGVPGLGLTSKQYKLLAAQTELEEEAQKTRDKTTKKNGGLVRAIKSM